MRSEDLDGASGLVEITAELHRCDRDDIALEAAVSRLSREPSVTSVSWKVCQPTVPTAAEE
jgi:putative Mg2+ transporter-C (MgtC) family protein